MALKRLTQAEADMLNTSADPAESLVEIGTRLRALEEFSKDVQLVNFREVASNDIQTIATKAAGVIGSNSTNVRLNRVNGATNKALRIEIASNLASGVAEMTTCLGLPTNVDSNSDMVVSFRARMQTGASSATMTIRTQFNENAATSSTAVALTSTYAAASHTISAASIPASASSLTVSSIFTSTEAAKNLYITKCTIEGGLTP